MSVETQRNHRYLLARFVTVEDFDCFACWAVARPSTQYCVVVILHLAAIHQATPLSIRFFFFFTKNTKFISQNNSTYQHSHTTTCRQTPPWHQPTRRHHTLTRIVRGHLTLSRCHRAARRASAEYRRTVRHHDTQRICGCFDVRWFGDWRCFLVLFMTRAVLIIIIVII